MQQESSKMSAISQLDAIVPQLFHALRSEIVEMRLVPGTALSEKEISLRFGVSRQPVREAFIKLAQVGLVEIRPSRGTFVRKISVREVADARFVRETLEVSLVRHACKFVTPADIDELDELIEKQKGAAAKNDFTQFNICDEAFHIRIGDIVECDYALRTLEGARTQTDRIRFMSLGEATPIAVLVKQHEDIVRAVAARDEDAAELFMRRHLREILAALPTVAQQRPDFFDDQDIPEHTKCLSVL